MIHVLDVLGKDYKNIKEYIIRTDFNEETLKSFSNKGIIPPLSSAKLNDELCFFNFIIENYKITFFEDKIYSILFMSDENDTISIIQNLRTQESFNFFSNQQIEETEWINKDNISEEGFTEWKTKTFEFEESLVFNPENLENYGLITFLSEELKIIIKNHTIDGNTFYLFELESNIHRVLKNSFKNN